MARQYFCWKVRLTFRCGCTEDTPTAHLCGPSREGCNSWLTIKRTDKDCEEHRVHGWGLNKAEREGGSSSSGGDSDSDRETGTRSAAAGRDVRLGDVEGEGYHALTQRQRREGGEGEVGWQEGYYTRRRV